MYLKILLLMALLNFSLAEAGVRDLQINKNKVVQIAVTEIPSSLSPYALNTLNALADQYSHLFFDPLMRWGQNRQLEYRLIDKLDVINNKKTRFSLKKNIYFHSGNLMTSKDIIWSFKEALSNKYLQKKLQYKLKLTRINDYQFDIESPLTQDQLFDYLTHIFVLDSHYYIKHKIGYNFVQSPISEPIKILPLSGTGPYQVSSFLPGVNLHVQASINYWDNKPVFNNLNFLKIKSATSRLYALLADDIDISESITNKNINSIHFLDNKDIYQMASLNALFLVFNEHKNVFFRNKVARNAIHLAINRTGILKHILKGTGKVENTFNLMSSPVTLPVYDTTRAKQLLKQLGMPKTLSLLVMKNKFSHTDEITFTLKNMFKKVGIKLVVTEVINIEQWVSLQYKHDMMLAMWHSDLIEKNNVYQDIFTNSLLSQYLDSLLKEQKKELSMLEKINIFEKFQLEDRIIPLFSKNKIWATDKAFYLQRIFSVNAIPYWHLLTANQ